MIASHQPKQPFSNRYCEGLTPDTCAQIYIIRSLGVERRTVHSGNLHVALR